jgi:hypothetical protein
MRNVAQTCNRRNANAIDSLQASFLVAASQVR